VKRGQGTGDKGPGKGPGRKRDGGRRAAERTSTDGVSILQPDGWKVPRGYANGVAARGRLVFVAGQVGWDQATERIVGSDFVAQVRRALDNVLAVLRAGGAEAAHVVRLTWYVTDRAEYVAARRAVGVAYREVFGDHYPAMTLVEVAGLLEPGAKVEIEATAVVPD
jgi:enamine deaminase RidA (YjgF/YER057c/UK114 family)